LVAASPGAPTANLYSKLVGADVPLNLTLTAMNSLISTLTLPLITTLAIAYYATETAAFEFPRNRIVEIFFLVTIPVIAGIFTNRHYPVLARKLDKPIRVFSVVTLIVIIVGAVAKEFDLLKDNIATIGWSILVFNLLSLSVAYFIPNILGVAKRSCSAIMFGSGLHNGSIPLFVAVSVLNSREAVVPIGLYTIIAYFTAGLAGLIVKRYHESEEVLTPQRKAS
jgi:bile acid:Na+ symporter, BASS family